MSNRGKPPASPPPIPFTGTSPTVEYRSPSELHDLAVPVAIDPKQGGADGGVPWFEGSIDGWEARGDRAAAPAAAPAGRLSTDRLRDEGEIARGGMGSIRRIHDAQLLRRVAMKVLDPAMAARPDSAQRFLSEARITGHLEHPNIVPVHDLVIDDRGVASNFTMKLVNGDTLTQLIAAQKTQRDLEKLLQILVKVCDAVSFAHSRGVVHRDLKPDNIMAGTHGQVYVMDWGCAQVVERIGAHPVDRAAVGGPLDPDGIVIGTVNYMAPEQAWGKISQIDQRTDVFALGGILYKMLTGSPPYPGPPEQALPLAQRGAVRPPEESTGAAVKPPTILSQIAMKALARDPAQRHQSVDKFSEELQAFLRGGNWFAVHKFPPGAVIVSEGDRADAAYIITAGRCEVTKRDPVDPNRRVTLRTLESGDVFGETAIFADAPRSASVTAIDEVSAVVFERREFEELFRSSWLGVFVKALASRFLDHDARLSWIRQAVEGPPR